jgi:saccharopine dehydrogenase (NAD+, L-lysine forming)
MKIGILREGKMPRDKRVPFSPAQCVVLQQEFGIHLIIQPSEWRCFTDQEYMDAGITLQENLSDCNVLMGIKEVPILELIPQKKYLFFSHTIKKQAHNKMLLQALLTNNIQMIDYECLTDPQLNRIIGFGYYAGIVGAYNAILAYGKRFSLFELKPAFQCHDLVELREELRKVRLTNIKMIVTGNGRVANGAIEMMGLLRTRRVTPYEFMNYSFREAVYTQLHSNDYNESKTGLQWNREEFYAHPEKFKSTFAKFTPHCDMLIHCSFWDPRAPKLFEKSDMKKPDFRLSVIADVTCDINGSIPSTTKASSIAEPFYGYNPLTEKTTQYPFDNDVITVMAIDNLPCELPRDASESFGKELIEKVIPALLGNDADGLIERASICLDGKLTKRFEYLNDFAY